MSQIADFLRARIAERQAIAEAAAAKAGSGDWRYKPGDDYVSWVKHDEYASAPINRETWWPLVTEAQSYVGDMLDDEIGHHIAASGPDAVIADIDAKLALVDELDYEPPATEDESDADLHARRAHPAWEYATTEGPRKQWDDADVPPVDEAGEPDPTWERNVDAGRDGWERWDYTEESYWRRLRPDGPRLPYIPRGLRILAQPFAGHPGYREEWKP